MTTSLHAFRNPLLSWSGHAETIIPALFRKVKINYRRERFILSDGDFIDLDRLSANNKKLLILFHGLEGNSQSRYIMGFARYFAALQWDICAVNFRSCSGEMNRKLISYHSGKTDDVAEVMNKLALGHYETMAAVGFSLGANVLLKYASGYASTMPISLTAIAAVSAPVDLNDSALQMARFENTLYMNRFLVSLNAKMKSKAIQFPGQIDLIGINKIRTFHAFDDRFTAPIHGFRNALDYYEKCSSLPVLSGIKIPTLILNAQNDPFLGKNCYPGKDTTKNALIQAEYPEFGGHVGFSEKFPNGNYYSERRVDSFFQQEIFHKSF